ncbi:MAG: RNA polymerase factor sigma-54 [Muribaculaceae bacterium]|jgi:RNA polymerase sigma-54 factor|nr:RNA polymerase factor sigma-54 [Muribaculaceae bacterium]GFI13877.1 RNA polymerase sigma-54 factor [Muribaculaceae bacterium]
MAGTGKESLRQVQQQALQQRLNIQNVALGRLLEMNMVQFEDEVRRELDDNPALELKNGETDKETDDFNETPEQLQLADYADADDIPYYKLEALNHEAGGTAFDPASVMPDDSDSVLDILLRRLSNETELQPDELNVARYIIGNLDSNGYLTRSLEDIADDMAINEGIEVSRNKLIKAFEAVRALEPAGIGAIDLRDCLLLQLDRLELTPEVLTAILIIKDNFELFAKKHYDRLGNAVGTSASDLERALRLIQSLNPKPAASLAGTPDSSPHIIPDFILDYDATTELFTVSLSGRQPDLGIEESFSATHQAGGRGSSEADAFIKKKRDEATSFIKLAEMRGATLLAIAKTIVSKQSAFFASGDPAEIRPMILKDISAVTGLDISIISRAVAGKYILAPHGVYPLKYLFNERSSASSDTSSLEILEAIKKLINSEDKSSPLTDQELTEKLQASGYDIARRTVAKYRERLGYPVGRLRKQFSQ